MKFVKAKRSREEEGDEGQLLEAASDDREFYARLVGVHRLRDEEEEEEEAGCDRPAPPPPPGSICAMFTEMSSAARIAKRHFPLLARVPNGARLLRAAGWDGETGELPVATRWTGPKGARSGLGSKRRKGSEKRVTHFSSAYSTDQVKAAASAQLQTKPKRTAKQKRMQRRKEREKRKRQAHKDKQLYREIVQAWRD